MQFNHEGLRNQILTTIRCEFPLTATKYAIIAVGLRFNVKSTVTIIAQHSRNVSSNTVWAIVNHTPFIGEETKAVT